MCRWLAYSGNPVYLDELLFKPEHSLIDQSLSATRSKFTTNGDGFGVGWYTRQCAPGLYKSVRPAWNDANLRDLAHHIESPVFVAHVRATTGTAVQRTNCHPFRHGRWLFVHNGQIRGFDRIKRELAMAVDPALYPAIMGSTDSELLFFLALTFGLESDAIIALEQATGLVEKAGADAGIADVLDSTIGITNGEKVYAVRYSTTSEPPSLYLSRSMHAITQIHQNAPEFSEQARVVVSEPLGHMSEVWDPIPPATAITVSDGEIRQRPFNPA
jgi:predicted glutamine amidotransferase